MANKEGDKVNSRGECREPSAGHHCQPLLLGQEIFLLWIMGGEGGGRRVYRTQMCESFWLVSVSVSARSLLPILGLASHTGATVLQSPNIAITDISSDENTSFLLITVANIYKFSTQRSIPLCFLHLQISITPETKYVVRIYIMQFQ